MESKDILLLKLSLHRLIILIIETETYYHIEVKLSFSKIDDCFVGENKKTSVLATTFRSVHCCHYFYMLINTHL